MPPASRSHLLGLSLLALGLAGIACQKDAPATGKTGSGEPRGAVPTSQLPSAEAAKPAGAEPAREPFVDPLGAATLELSGAVVFPPGAPPSGRVLVFVSHGDCLDASAKPLRRMPATEDGAFMLHTLAVPGSELSVCALVQPAAESGAAAFYGQAATRIRVEKTSDLVIHDLQVPLRAGPPRRFPAAEKPAAEKPAAR